MQPKFWHERWRSGQIGFHQSTVDRHLKEYWADLVPLGDGGIFVPLCGKSLDLTWLRDRGHSVTGVELSAAALESFCMENGVPATRRTLGEFDVYEAERLRLLCGDFFALTAGLLGPVSAVYDRASLISWSPELRASYVEHMRQLTRRNTQTLLITLEYPQSQMTGPPFSLSAHDVKQLYGRDHEIRELGRQDVLANEPRLRARGARELTEVCYRLTRL